MATDCGDVASGMLLVSGFCGFIGGVIGWLACKASMWNELQERKKKSGGEDQA